MASSRSKTKGSVHATAVHGVASTREGPAHLVGIGNLRVMITRDEGVWFAQALEIDYAIQGSSLDDLKRRFERGLAATIDEHLTVYGGIEKLLVPAPAEVWRGLLDVTVSRYKYTHVSVHRALPFKGITYVEIKAA